MKTLTLAITLLAFVGFAQAAPHEHDMAAHATHAALHQGLGVVKALKSGKMQIAHEPIPTLEWPAMTMWFDLKGHASHDIKAGDRVYFEIVQGENKKWGIINIKLSR